jgi:hypothetical protein
MTTSLRDLAIAKAVMRAVLHDRGFNIGICGHDRGLWTNAQLANIIRKVDESALYLSGLGAKTNYELALVVGVMVAGWVVYSAFEADAYNRITGADVSTWQAMWVELRVQGEPR